jgi:hypothetical protein
VPVKHEDIAVAINVEGGEERGKEKVSRPYAPYTDNIREHTEFADPSMPKRPRLAHRTSLETQGDKVAVKRGYRQLRSSEVSELAANATLREHGIHALSVGWKLELRKTLSQTARF